MAPPPSPDSSDAGDVDPLVGSDEDLVDGNGSCHDDDHVGTSKGRNFFVMKRRNAFWKIEHRDSLKSASGCLKSTSHNNSTLGLTCPSGSTNLYSHPNESGFSPRLPSARKFSVQF